MYRKTLKSQNLSYYSVELLSKVFLVLLTVQETKENKEVKKEWEGEGVFSWKGLRISIMLGSSPVLHHRRDQSILCLLLVLERKSECTWHPTSLLDTGTVLPTYLTPPPTLHSRTPRRRTTPDVVTGPSSCHRSPSLTDPCRGSWRKSPDPSPSLQRPFPVRTTTDDSFASDGSLGCPVWTHGSLTYPYRRSRSLRCVGIRFSLEREKFLQSSVSSTTVPLVMTSSTTPYLPSGGRRLSDPWGGEWVVLLGQWWNLSSTLLNLCPPDCPWFSRAMWSSMTLSAVCAPFRRRDPSFCLPPNSPSTLVYNSFNSSLKKKMLPYTTHLNSEPLYDPHSHPPDTTSRAEEGGTKCRKE